QDETDCRKRRKPLASNEDGGVGKVMQCLDQNELQSKDGNPHKNPKLQVQGMEFKRTATTEDKGNMVKILQKELGEKSNDLCRTEDDSITAAKVVEIQVVIKEDKEVPEITLDQST
ncbi:unnamed protein product, partial [Ilex paraguariensis]